MLSRFCNNYALTNGKERASSLLLSFSANLPSIAGSLSDWHCDYIPSLGRAWDDKFLHAQ